MTSKNGDMHYDDQEEEYNSASDEDFDPNAPTTRDNNENEESASSSEEEGEDAEPTKKKPKPKSHTEQEDLDFDNSGDEATISKAKAKATKQKKRKHDAKSQHNDVEDEEDEEEGGEGGLIKTRAQRKAEAQERKPLVTASTASEFDVNALWAKMSAGGSSVNGASSTVQQTSNKNESAQPTPPSQDIAKPANGPPTTIHNSSTEKANPTASTSEHTITIKRKYNFAGQLMEEERVVPTSSAEAKLYLQEQEEAKLKTSSSVTDASKSKLSSNPGLRRPVKRKSMFGTEDAGSAAAKGPKLNTLQKSKLDWAKHVDTEGMSEELDEARKGKGSYLDRMEFIDRMNAKKG